MTVMTTPPVVASPVPVVPTSNPGCVSQFFGFVGCLVKGLGLALVAILLLLLLLVGVYILAGLFIGAPVVLPPTPVVEAPAAPVEAPTAPTPVVETPVVTTQFADAQQFFDWAYDSQGWLATVDRLNSVTDGKVTFSQHSEITKGLLIWCTLPEEHLGNVTLKQGEGSSGVFFVHTSFTLSNGQCGTNVRFQGWPQ